ncbi:pro-epidermal growth factor-like isoform X2 [Haliotis asinina]|uniref:pro-epidermal growth factor-like isoform X2 n=1 Tax=Haliotis asinina TaxID=109174 RepID=UPI0035325BD3
MLKMNGYGCFGTLCGFIFMNTVLTDCQADVMALVTDYNGPIYKVNTSSGNVSVVYRDVVGVEDLAYDSRMEHVYWSHLIRKNIQRVDLKDGQHTTILKVGKCQGLAIALESRLLFYSDDVTDVIRKYDLKTNKDTVIIRSNLGRAHAVSVDDVNRRVFWSDVGHNPKIEMANYGGGNRLTLVHAGAGIVTPTSLVVDSRGENLYWIDEHRSRSEIMVIRLNQTTVRSIPYDGRSDFFSFDLLNQNFYLIDLRQRNVFLSVPKTGGSMVSYPMPSGMSAYRSIRVFNTPDKCTEGYFGVNCRQSCGHCMDEVECDRSDGRCASGCEAGWFGVNCSQECRDGFFGVNCDDSCGHCRDGASCNKTDGRCSSGCEAGWFWYNCTQECTEGYFGVNCQQSCGHCMDEVECDRSDGRCASGCEAGWFGVNCSQECRDGFFGVNCDDSCGHCRDGASCNKTDGGCSSGCEAGWFGYNCTQGCDGGECDAPCANCSQAQDCVTGRCSSAVTAGYNSIPIVAGVCGAVGGVFVLAVIIFLTRRHRGGLLQPPGQGAHTVVYKIMEDIQDPNTSDQLISI